MNPYPKPVKSEKKKPKKIKPRSDKRAKQEREYAKKRKEYAEKNPLCEICGKVANDLHHKGRRLGDMLTDESTYMSVCRPCHKMIHDNEKEARKQGYLI